MVTDDATPLLLDPALPAAEIARFEDSPSWREVPAAEMPEPYRSLLVHDRDMTSTLERFHGEEIGLRVLSRGVLEQLLVRRVVLFGARTGRAVEIGAIRIHLPRFAPAPRALIHGGQRPLGAILADFAIPYLSRPQLFFSLQADAELREVLDLPSPETLYGRRNLLLEPGGEILAEVVEILPPETLDESS